ncbi:MAG: ABC transporter ATP-binding protein [Clostridia bacterium]|nr:ABC transporter ATP-binding protein [Clostridia bacterium]
MLKFNHVSFAYDKKPVLVDFSMELVPCERLAVMGPSGCGKSTLLHLAAGLLTPTAGNIDSDFLPPAVAFQEPRLFGHLTVKQNLLAVQKKPDEKAVARVLELVQLQDEIDAYPDELSGGMQSRVSLARALLFESDLYLFDEPFAALDEATRKTVLENVKAFLTEKNAAAILVTHQHEDAEAFATRRLTLSAD